MSGWFHRIEKTLERGHLLAWLWTVITPTGLILSAILAAFAGVIGAIDAGYGAVGLILVLIISASVGVLVTVGFVLLWSRAPTGDTKRSPSSDNRQPASQWQCQPSFLWSLWQPFLSVPPE